MMRKQQGEDSALADFLFLLGRLGLAAVFAGSAMDKFLAPEPELKQIEALHLPASATSLAQAAGVCESIGASALALGIFPRTAATLLAGFLGYVSLEVLDFWSKDLPAAVAEPKKRAFASNLGVIGGLLYIAAAGPGRFSLQGSAKRGRSARHLRRIVPMAGR